LNGRDDRSSAVEGVRRDHLSPNNLRDEFYISIDAKK
jgi:hypothetical protein